ncbi:MAG TPA: phenylacetic acid degradation bifunctional protein PaaZ [Acidobacteriota bacterium]|nr:phenylacetic acid degradation bifunctional protein PaaZ [Acidobacteriota bacterium]
MKLRSYAQGQWAAGQGTGVDLLDAATGEKIAESTSRGLDFAGMLDYARRVAGPRLRKLTFHKRAYLLKDMAKYLTERKEELYSLSFATGATRSDSWLDIDGGIGTLFVYSSKGRRELPNECFHVEGNPENISRSGSFVGRHICVPLRGAAVHINAFNFPCWGMLEKLAPSFLAGMPSIVKPATSTSYLACRLVEIMVESGIFPEGSLQLICGGIGDLLDHLTCQDVVTFTGSSPTARRLRQHPAIVGNSVRFNQESDSLNFCMLGPDAAPGTEEFDLFIKEVVREMTAKAGQKCTAIRRTLVPAGMEEDVISALTDCMAGVLPGDPTRKDVRMGPLATRGQVREVRQRVDELRQAAEIVWGNPDDFEVIGGNPEKGAFFPSLLLYCARPGKNRAVHEVEAFGPVNTVMPYASVEEAIDLACLGRGSLVGSLFTADDQVARKVVLGTGAYHGRIMLINAESARESTGHGSPLPHLVHGGPGRAGGGEELGGIRSVLKYMQRTALQGSPTTLSRVCGVWMTGARGPAAEKHPFRKFFEDLEIGETLLTHRRTITEADIVNFAGVSGDHFYAHMDDIAARESIFERRVAHGYFVIAAAAGLFVDPAPGPVLANYGLDDLRFTKPVYIGDTIQVRLACKQKTLKTDDQGVVSWGVEVINQNQEVVASYTVLTLVRRRTLAAGDGARMEHGETSA